MPYPEEYDTDTTEPYDQTVGSYIDPSQDRSNESLIDTTGNLETDDVIVDQYGRTRDAAGNELTEGVSRTYSGPTGSVSTSGFSADKLIKEFKDLIAKGGNIMSTPAGLLTGLAAIYALKNQTSPSVQGYKGKIPTYTATRTAEATQAAPRDYGTGAKGRRYFSDIVYAAQGKYLRGDTDGMADKINTSIDDVQPAKLSHGEFVIPADVVSHLGNGNSDAGAKKLYEMMDRVRMARTGTKQQGKKINPNKFMPGGIASYNGGGAVAFEEGGTTTVASGLSDWSGPLVTGMLGKAQALSNLGYNPFTGALSAGISPLQQTAFTGLQGLQTPTEFTTASNLASGVGGASFAAPGTASTYMSPYTQAVTDIQKREAQRQSEIQNLQNKAAFAKAGAFGGSRQAIVEAERQRNLAQQMGDIEARGLQSAYDTAMRQFNAEQAAKTQAAQLLGDLGTREFATELQGLQALLGAGGVQRQAEKEAIEAEKGEFEKQRLYPYQQLEFLKSMLTGLPIGSRTESMEQDAFGKLLSDMGGIASLYKLFGGK
jgi:hypothetical protein